MQIIHQILVLASLAFLSGCSDTLFKEKSTSSGNSTASKELPPGTEDNTQNEQNKGLSESGAEESGKSSVNVEGLDPLDDHALSGDLASEDNDSWIVDANECADNLTAAMSVKLGPHQVSLQFRRDLLSNGDKVTLIPGAWDQPVADGEDSSFEEETDDKAWSGNNMVQARWLISGTPVSLSSAEVTFDDLSGFSDIDQRVIISIRLKAAADNPEAAANQVIHLQVTEDGEQVFFSQQCG